MSDTKMLWFYLRERDGDSVRDNEGEELDACFLGFVRSLTRREAAFSVGQTENLRGERGLQFAFVSWTLSGTTN